MPVTLRTPWGNAEGPVADGDGALGRTCGQAAELPVLDEDVEEEEADVDAVDAAGLESVDEDVVDVVVVDFDEAGELLDDEPRLSFR
ncbi:hypothetical protein GCM10010222_73190 [Streptomyces tanashiensis]|nr:hypothetical protein GCM10010222_73190 [Streptomyces tanashiensis]